MLAARSYTYMLLQSFTNVFKQFEKIYEITKSDHERPFKSNRNKEKALCI